MLKDRQNKRLAMAKHKKILRGFAGSTEPGARQVLNQIKSTRKRAKPQKDTGGKTTAKSPFKPRTPAQTAAAKKKAIAKRDAKIKNLPTKASPKKKQAKRKSYGRTMS